MKLSKIYRKQIWRCNKCKEEVKPQDIELIPISQEIEKPKEMELLSIDANSIRFTFPQFCTYVDKKGILCSALSDKLGESNFNKMMKCPNCGFIALQGFDKINQNSEETKKINNVISFEEYMKTFPPQQYYSSTTHYSDDSTGGM